MVGATLVIGGGAYLNYRMGTQAQRQMPDLTLANLEAMAYTPPAGWDDLKPDPFPEGENHNRWKPNPFGGPNICSDTGTSCRAGID